jgi:hypothetical protein
MYINFNFTAYTRVNEGADKSLALQRKQQSTGLKKNIITLNSPLELYTLIASLF